MGDQSQSRVTVVGAGNAGLCAALAAHESGAQVTVVERAPESQRGGDTAFTGGAMRVAYRGADDIRELVPELSESELRDTDFGKYTEADFLDDIGRVTEYRTDPDLADLVVSQSYETLLWLRDKGVRFLPMYGRYAFRVNGMFKFWGGLTLEAVGGGPGLSDAEFRAAADAGIDVLYGTRAVSLIHSDNDNRMQGVRVREHGKTRDITADAVILAAGGFQANTEWRTRYLGPGWDVARVRGTRFNTGDGIQMALDIGASSRGNWSGCHAVGWDRNAPEFGDLSVGYGFTRNSYAVGILINAHGKRFLDEGADFRSYTYAKYGRRVLEQPNQFAWQVFDSKVLDLLSDEYRMRHATSVKADTLEELATRLEDVDTEGFLDTIHTYNLAVREEVPFDPNVKDGKCTVGLEPNKSNWANTIADPPFQAFAVTGGITFTFGGLRIDTGARVIDTDGEAIPGLYGCGELVGGLFYFNYPAGSGLTAGAVLGRIAGGNAAKLA